MPERPRRDRLPRTGAGHRLSHVRVPLPGPRRHPGDADRRGREARSRDALTDLDDVQALRAADPSSMLATVTALPSHIREAYANGAAATGLPALDDVTAVVVCGMGGSAVAGDVLRASFRDRLGMPVDVNRSPVLPAFSGPHTLV